MIHLLKEVARGKRGARDLSYEEACGSCGSNSDDAGDTGPDRRFFHSGTCENGKRGGTRSLRRVCRKYTLKADGLAPGIDCAGPYDGRKKSFFATFATAFVLASAGVPAVLHGSASLPPKWGITLQDIVQAAGAGIEPPEQSRRRSLHAARRSGVLYASTEEWCPPLGALRPIREELGMRTILNSAEKLLDIGSSPYVVFGVHHNTVFDRLARLLIKLGCEKALIVQGVEGSEDLFIDRPTRAYLVENGEFRLQIFDPESYGLDTPLPEQEWTPQAQLAVTEAVLQGTADLAYTNQVLFNGAARLHLSGRVGSLEEGLYTCKALLDGGDAYAAYLSWCEAMQSPTMAAVKLGASGPKVDA